MKIKLSKSQWQTIGRTARWTKTAKTQKTASEDSFINETYVQQVADELKRRGDDVVQIKDYHKIIVNHLISPSKILRGLEIKVFEKDNSGKIELYASINGRILAIIDGTTPANAIDNMNDRLLSIISKI
jgi:hypothetical protein